MNQITLNLAAVKQRIAVAAKRYGREAESIKLLAVSKRQPAALVGQAREAGLEHFGENFVQEAISKRDQCPATLTWHFIGRIQSNKTRVIAQNFDWVHTIDNLRTAQRLAAQRDPQRPLNVCVQVKLDDTPGRAGTPPADVIALAQQIHALGSLALRGLMVLPPPETSFERQREHFATVADLARRCRDAGLPTDELSMGMTGDLEAAIAEGATWLRIGTAIFGPRPPQGYPVAHR